MLKHFTNKTGNRVVAVKDSPEGYFKAGDTGFIATAVFPFITDVAVFFDNIQQKIYIQSDKANEFLRDFPSDDVIRKEIIQLIDRQFAKGIAKYGAALSENPKNLSVLEMLNYLAEELIDAIHYNRKLKEMLMSYNRDVELTIEEKAVLSKLLKKAESDESC